MKKIKFILFALVALVLLTVFMGIYTVQPTFPGKSITEWNGGIWKFTGTFVAATDTFYFPFSPPRPYDLLDTTVVAAQLGVAPYSQSGTTDTVKVTWRLQYSDDNTNWSTTVALGVDSTKTGTEGVYTWTRCFVTRFTGTGIHPYYRITAIGNETSGGATNIIGNKLLVFLLRQSRF